MKDRPVWAVLTAAGSGTRLGYDQPKALVKVGQQSLLSLALARIQAVSGLAGVVVTCPADQVEAFAAEGSSQGELGSAPILFVPGGASRQASVYEGLKSIVDWADIDGVSRGSDIVLVHDAARPLAPVGLMEDLVSAVLAGAVAVIPGMPVADTIKQVTTSEEGDETVTATLPRTTLRAAQTPQAFDLVTLLQLHHAAVGRGQDESTAATDDAALAEEAGVPVRVIPGSPRAFKVTTGDDLRRLFDSVES